MRFWTHALKWSGWIWLKSWNTNRIPIFYGFLLPSPTSFHCQLENVCIHSGSWFAQIHLQTNISSEYFGIWWILILSANFAAFVHQDLKFKSYHDICAQLMFNIKLLSATRVRLIQKAHYYFFPGISQLIIWPGQEWV